MPNAFGLEVYASKCHMISKLPVCYITSYVTYDIGTLSVRKSLSPQKWGRSAECIDSCSICKQMLYDYQTSSLICNIIYMFEQHIYKVDVYTPYPARHAEVLTHENDVGGQA